ncbi:MAG: cytochrome b [Zetaproteobacteria bacterium]|nr:cytochrome b [Zetaproteobacteria bacterium]
MLTNGSTTYGSIAISLHWLMAILIFSMFALGLWMVDLNYYHPWYHDAAELHKSMGILLFLLLLFRFTWRFRNPIPKPLGKAWENSLASLVHRSHYLLLFAIAITGYFIPTANGVGIDLFNLITIPATLSFSKTEVDLIGELHQAIAWSIVILALLHAGAAMKHHFIDKDATLIRMLGCQCSQKSKQQGD